ncbi:hypothetical protein KKH36_02480 [Patescibacteria group bacterium]|nr:hypothetical protein [Patescibacteria group bacterium]
MPTEIINESIVWLDIIGLFLFLAGFIIGLGAVIVIDLQGFLGKNSVYWTETTIRTHKITKPLIWLGIILTFIGGFIFYRNDMLIGIPLVHLLIGVVLILNGIFLSFKVSPFLLKREIEGRAKELIPYSWQKKITISLIISDIGWWGGLLLLVLYLLK